MAIPVILLEILFEITDDGDHRLSHTTLEDASSKLLHLLLQEMPYSNHKSFQWLKWLIWINPVQYAFEALMANEFTGLDIRCEPPYIVPGGPNTTPSHQSCAIQGSSPDSLVVNGSQYIQNAYTYTRAHLWRNFGIIIAWFLFFVSLTMLGTEIQKPNKSGSSVTVFKRGEIPKSVKDAIEHKRPPGDEESVEKRPSDHSLTSDEAEKKVQDIAKNTSIFTWQNVNYTIPYKGGKRKLLQGVHGYVKPGRLTALMGASGAGYVVQSSEHPPCLVLVLTRSQKNHTSQRSGPAD